MASSHSCDVFVVTGEKEETFFAVHLPHSGGTNGVCYALFDFLDDQRMPGKLSQLISETCSKENDFDFLYEAWKPEDRTSVFILDILYDRLNERLNEKPKEELKNPQKQDQAVYDLGTRKKGRGNWRYVINLEKEIITTKYKHHDRDVFSFDEVGKYLPQNIKSCDVLVSSGKERVFAVHLPHSGGHAVRQALLDFLKHREKFEELKRLISKARSKEDNFDFLYQGWDKSDRTNTHILQILCTKLDEKIKNPQRRENAVSNLQLKKEGRGDCQYDINLDYEAIRSTYGRHSITWNFKDIAFFLGMEAENNDQNKRYSAGIMSEMGERDKTLNKHNDGGCTAPSGYGCNTRVRGDASPDPNLATTDDEAQYTTNWDDDGTKYSLARISNGGSNGGSNVPFNENPDLKLPTRRSFEKQSCNVIVRSEKGQPHLFAFHLPKNGGLYGEGRSIFDFLEDSRAYQELKNLVSNACKKEDDFDFLYQGWDLEDRETMFVLNTLIDKLKYPKRQEKVISNVRASHRSRADWIYDIVLGQDIIRVTDTHTGRLFVLTFALIPQFWKEIEETPYDYLPDADIDKLHRTIRFRLTQTNQDDLEREIEKLDNVGSNIKTILARYTI